MKMGGLQHLKQKTARSRSKFISRNVTMHRDTVKNRYKHVMIHTVDRKNESRFS